MKWIWVILLVIIGVVASIVAIEYFTVAIHALPSWIPGQKAHARGHYHKRGAGAAVVAFVAFVVAGYLTYRNLQTSSTTPSSPAPSRGTPTAGDSSVDQLLSSPQPDPGQPDAR